MPELRQNPATKQWVIISAERAKRPDDFRRKEPRVPVPEFSRTCPFCPGNEALLPPEGALHEEKEDGLWQVRVVPNKYSALVPVGESERREQVGFFHSFSGVGKHEVVIESRQHNANLATMSEEEAFRVLKAYRARYLEMRKDARFKHITIFKNHGPKAGTSLEHTHSQIVATPIVPHHVRAHLAEAVRYYDDTGDCVYCHMVKKEEEARERIIFENDAFSVFSPFASARPFETWIIPKVHHGCFGCSSDPGLKSLAEALKKTLQALYDLLDNPDYNLLVQTAPFKDEEEDYYHWHIRILPHLTEIAGFEMGSGIFINVTKPEDCAAALREALV